MQRGLFVLSRATVEFVENVRGGQMLVAIAKMVPAELAGLITLVP